MPVVRAPFGSFEFQDGTPQPEIEAHMLQNEAMHMLNQGAQPQNALAQMLAGVGQELAVSRASRNTLPAISGRDTFGMTPQQTTATLGMMQQDRQNSVQNEVYAREQVRRQQEAEKDRAQSLKLAQEKMKNDILEMKMKADQDKAMAELKAKLDIQKADATGVTEKNKASASSAESLAEFRALQSQFFPEKAQAELGKLQAQTESTDALTRYRQAQAANVGQQAGKPPAYRTNYPVVNEHGGTDYMDVQLDPYTGQVVSYLGPSKPTSRAETTPPEPKFSDRVRAYDARIKQLQTQRADADAFSQNDAITEIDEKIELLQKKIDDELGIESPPPTIDPSAVGAGMNVGVAAGFANTPPPQAVAGPFVTGPDGQLYRFTN